MQGAVKTIRTIPATFGRLAEFSFAPAVKKRVAGYARVSTDDEEQLNSYEAQVDFFTNHIKSNADWIFVEVYEDEAVSGTSTRRRDGFNRMIKDALDGKIDLIVTKSVSRFARNTVDTLTIVRQLKEKGVEVYFQKENIYTLDSKGELLITIMSSLAQEESRSISENVTWGQRKRMQDGKVSLPYGQFLGYEKGADGLPKIVESEAKIVRLIYSLFMEGKTPSWIAAHLTETDMPTPAGKKQWQYTTVLSILQNEKYKGEALLQKGYTVDFLTKKKKKNEGEIPQYYITNSHPAIITPEIFEIVQNELIKRKSVKGYKTGGSPFSGRIICGDCGGFYGSKLWHSTSKYRRTIWQCNHKYNGGDTCKTPHLYEIAVQKAFIEAFNRLFGDKERLVEDYAAIIKVLTDTSGLDREAAALQSECDVVIELMRKCVEENAQIALNQEEYTQQYGALITRYEAAKNRIDEILSEKQARTAKRENISQFMFDIQNRDGLLDAFDEKLWLSTVESVTVRLGDELTVMFKDGSEVCVGI